MSSILDFKLSCVWCFNLFSVAEVADVIKSPNWNCVTFSGKIWSNIYFANTLRALIENYCYCRLRAWIMMNQSTTTRGKLTRVKLKLILCWCIFSSISMDRFLFCPFPSLEANCGEGRGEGEKSHENLRKVETWDCNYVFIYSWRHIHAD